MSDTALNAKDTTGARRNTATTVAAEISTAYFHLSRAQRKTNDPRLLNKLEVVIREVLDALNEAEAVRMNLQGSR